MLRKEQSWDRREMDSRSIVQQLSSPPAFPAATIVPIADARAVSEVTLTAVHAVTIAPKLYAPSATQNAAR